MLIGAVFPQNEFGHDFALLRDYAQTAEALGYHHILTYDHVLGANPERPGGWQGPYTHQDAFLEPFVLFSFMAAVTQGLNFVTGILIAPQRQTALIAKQAATLDAISGGRLRLGIGVGWNPVEYVALGENFHDRGRRSEEQIAVLRLLWTQPLVTFLGRWHTIPDAGLNPLPVQQPIPIWLGGHAEITVDRVARLGDGWFPMHRRAADAQPLLDRLWAGLEQAGRARSAVGVEARLSWGDGRPESWRARLDEWRQAGATHVSINTMRAGFARPAEHITALRHFAEAVMTG